YGTIHMSPPPKNVCSDTGLSKNCSPSLLNFERASNAGSRLSILPPRASASLTRNGAPMKFESVGTATWPRNSGLRRSDQLVGGSFILDVSYRIPIGLSANPTHWLSGSLNAAG